MARHLYCHTQEKQPSYFWVGCLFLLIMVVIGLSMTGCITRSACDRKFPEIIHDSIHTVVERICVPDSQWFEPQQLVFHDSIPCPDYHATSTKGHLKATIDIKSGHLIVICHEDSLLKIIDNYKDVVTIYRSQTKAPQTITVTRSTSWDNFCKWGFGILLCLNVLFILFALLAKKIPF